MAPPPLTSTRCFLVWCGGRSDSVTRFHGDDVTAEVLTRRNGGEPERVLGKGSSGSDCNKTGIWKIRKGRQQNQLSGSVRRSHGPQTRLDQRCKQGRGSKEALGRLQNQNRSQQLVWEKAP